MARQGRLDKVEEWAAEGRRVLTRVELDRAGVSAQERRSQCAAERWRQLRNGAVALDHGPLVGEAAWREALVLVADQARLGGITALQAAGLKGLDDDDIHIWVEKSSRKGLGPRTRGIVVHESRRWGAEDAVVVRDLPRARPEVAAVQAALWASTPRQASLFLVMPVQQRLVTAEQCCVVMERVRRHRFRHTLALVLADIAGGSHSLNELDFLRFCRREGLPEPARQVLRKGPDGRRYLDAEWTAYGVKVEVQGAGHGELLQALEDDLRLIDLACEPGAAVSVSVLSLRTNPAMVARALRRLLVSRGWSGGLRPTV